MKIHEISLEAKHLCRREHSGVLSTHSQSVEGYPFGSVMPFFMTTEGDPVIYISDLAQHTKNIKNNSKVSLTVYDAGQDDSQANGRVTILGDAELCESEEVEALYMALFASAKGYQKAHDFNFYKIKTHRVRYIGGFGKIHWIPADVWCLEMQEWQQDTSGMINHMNEDHLDAMQLMVQLLYGVNTDSLKMISAFQEGVHYRDDNGSVYFIPFAIYCETGMDVRKELVRLTQESRAKHAA